MKNLTLLLICITNFAFSQVKRNTSDLKEMGLNGKVKSIKQKVGVDVEINFNEEGYITEIIQSSNNRIIQKETNKYDTKNNKTENLVVSTTEKVRIKSTYNANNYKLTDSVFKNTDKWTTIFNYKYDKSGNILMKYEKVSGRKKVLMYNKDDNLITKKIKEERLNNYEFPSKDPADMTNKFLYDNNNNWILREEYLNEKLYSIFKRTIEYY